MAAAEKLVWSPIGGFAAKSGPSIDDLVRCVHCGLCLNACPTQRVTGLETESPRGRIHLIRAVRDGRMDITESFHRHMDLCLVCRSCETACPSGVQFGRLMEATRADLWDKPVGSRMTRFALRLAFEIVFPRRRLFRTVFRAMRLYQRSGMQRVLRLTGLLDRLPGNLGAQERLMPDLSQPFFNGDPIVAPRVAAAPRVGFVSGCVMSVAFGDVQRSTIRVLQRFGCQVVTPPAQPCCGALNVHAGERANAKRMARGLIESMLRADLDFVVINSAGCGSVMKEYAELFEDEPGYLPRVREFTAKVRDFSELMAELPVWKSGARPLKLEQPVTAVYQDACHLRHAQRITAQPRALLSSIEGLNLVELSLPDQCCGSAGIYNIQHPELSGRIMNAKLADIRSSGAQLVISANPGCILQLRTGLSNGNPPIPVVHIASLVDEAIEQARA